ncbi:MAG: glycosyltransferase family 2 protein [Lachnospiraceae bacterium]|nr:glycosyltransferase family 2 protein [Lachnospiraceae bacterium]
MESLYIIAPAYNEEENIEDFVNAWYPVLETHGNEASRLVVVNDGSTDKTYEKLCRLAAGRSRLVPLDKPNGGHGSALMTGYGYALENKADFIFQTDSDGQTYTSDFENFWKRRNTCDALFAYRPVRGDGKKRQFIERVLCLIIRMIFGVKLPDVNAPFRLMKRSYLEAFLDTMPEDYNLPNVILTTAGAYCGKKIRFLKIHFGPRISGKNSINIRKIFMIGIKAPLDFIRIKTVLTQKRQ